MKSAAQIDRRALCAVPRPDDHARLVPRGRDREIERGRIARELVDQVRAARAGQRRPLLGAALVQDGARAHPPRHLRARRRPLGGGQHREREARQQRGHQQADHPLSDDQHRVVVGRLAVEDQIDRGLHVRVQHRALRRQSLGHWREIGHRRHERARVRLEGEHAPPQPRGRDAVAGRRHRADRRIAVAERVAERRAAVRAQRFVDG